MYIDAPGNSPTRAKQSRMTALIENIFFDTILDEKQHEKFCRSLPHAVCVRLSYVHTDTVDRNPNKKR